MAFSKLQPDSATTVGLLTAAGVFLIYNNAMPSLSDLRAAPPHDATAETSRKHAAILSAILVAGVFLIARDLNSYAISGASLVGIDYLYKHSNATHPGTGKLDVSNSGASVSNIAQAYPMPDYTETA